jgi:hypothetical protein
MLWSTIKTSCKTYRSKTYNKKGDMIVYTKDEFTKGMNNNLVEILKGLEDTLSDWDDIKFK